MLSQIIALILLVLVSFPVYVSAVSEEIVIYSARKEHLIKPLFDQYTKKTGVKIKYITGNEGVLLERLKAEDKNTPADMLITVDAGNLWHAAQEGVLQPSIPIGLPGKERMSRWCWRDLLRGRLR